MIFSAVALPLVLPLAWPQNGVVMSMQPRPWPDVPELTAKMARSSSRQGNLAMRIRDELGEVYADARFAAAFGVRGRPGISPGQLMMASVLQFSENLTDRQAAEAVRDRMTWKYALGLELEDPGFDASVLSEFRSRLVAGDLTCLALDALLERLAGLGLVGRRPAAHRFHSRAGRDPGAEPAGAGRGDSAGGAGGAGGRGAGLADQGDR